MIGALRNEPELLAFGITTQKNKCGIIPDKKTPFSLLSCQTFRFYFAVLLFSIDFHDNYLIYFE